jgi:nucleoside-diphosphate-sugar epimerase
VYLLSDRNRFSGADTRARSWGHVNPIGPRACYDEGKRVAETLTYGFHRQDGVDVRVARIFNTYGPRSTSRCPCPASPQPR